MNSSNLSSHHDRPSPDVVVYQYGRPNKHQELAPQRLVAIYPLPEPCLLYYTGGGAALPHLHSLREPAAVRVLMAACGLLVRLPNAQYRATSRTAYKAVGGQAILLGTIVYGQLAINDINFARAPS